MQSPSCVFKLAAFAAPSRAEAFPHLRLPFCFPQLLGPAGSRIRRAMAKLALDGRLPGQNAEPRARISRDSRQGGGMNSPWGRFGQARAEGDAGKFLKGLGGGGRTICTPWTRPSEVIS